MAEPDHVFVNPLPNLAHGKQPAGFPFFYIKPAEHEHIIRKYYPKEKGPVTDIDPIGNSPVIIRKVALYDYGSLCGTFDLSVNRHSIILTLYISFIIYTNLKHNFLWLASSSLWLQP